MLSTLIFLFPVVHLVHFFKEYRDASRILHYEPRTFSIVHQRQCFISTFESRPRRAPFLTPGYIIILQDPAESSCYEQDIGRTGLLCAV
jgi:hypothetical protein